MCVCMCKKERKILPFAKTWMKLEGVELSETHQIEKNINEMIEEVNRTQVEEEELLSEHAYLYERKNKSFISVTF